MSSTADTDDVIEVSADGLTVRKRFAADEFPVPAIRFEIESDHDEPVTFRLSEEIPESFPMDKVGFHPDYYSDDWTAFQDNHVEFTGTLESGEPLVTVYGIRIDDESVVTEFLTEPTVVEVSSEDAADSDADAISDDVIETIVGDDRNQAVKDMISGESDSVPGLEDEEDLDLDLEDGVDSTDEGTEREDDEPDIALGFEEDEIPEAEEDEAIEAAPPDEQSLDLGLETDEADDDPEPSELDLGLEDDADIEPSEDTAPDDVETDTETAAEERPDVDTEDGDGGTETAVGDDDADEADLEAGEADEEPAAESPPTDVEDTDAEPATPDEPPIADEDEGLDDESTAEANETDAAEDESADEPAIALEGSIGDRLATEIRQGIVDEEDLEVLRSELHLEPSGSETAKVEHLQSRVEEVAAYTDALEAFLDEQGTGEQLIEELRDELASFEDDIAAMDDRLEGTESRVDGVETDVESLTDWTADLETDLGEVTDDVETVETDLENVNDDVETVDERVDDLADDVDDLEDDLADVREGLTDIQDWRDQLGSMFSDS
ncbi:MULTISPECIES: prolipoprotein diacylglyceryl transferase [Natrialbaceae]|uniref:AAA family ATPase n=1 Tax=Natrialbaceae TaxID=1644061 RepID=UPI00207CC07C|nr:AAA family ATPase [Natronococcus sp. CG52]